MCALSKYILPSGNFLSRSHREAEAKTCWKPHPHWKTLGCLEQHSISPFIGLVVETGEEKLIVTRTWEGRAGEELGGIPRQGSWAERALAPVGVQWEQPAATYKSTGYRGALNSGPPSITTVQDSLSLRINIPYICLLNVWVSYEKRGVMQEPLIRVGLHRTKWRFLLEWGLWWPNHPWYLQKITGMELAWTIIRMGKFLTFCLFVCLFVKIRSYWVWTIVTSLGYIARVWCEVG